MPLPIHHFLVRVVMLVLQHWVELLLLNVRNVYLENIVQLEQVFVQYVVQVLILPIMENLPVYPVELDNLLYKIQVQIVLFAPLESFKDLPLRQYVVRNTQICSIN